MFGLEKKGKPAFEFDLEKDVKNNPTKAKELMKVCEEKIQELKNLLRQGANTADYDNYGILLHAYAALQKVLTKLANKK